MENSISVIIPVLNEEEIIGETLAALKKLPGLREIIVVDGGSIDKTVEIARLHDVKICFSARGRARQLNTGALMATGKILLFLHADSSISEAGIRELHHTIKNPSIVGGGYCVSFDDKRLIFKLIAIGSNLRAKFFKIFFGDQGIFVKADSFKKIGGFPEIPIMEEWPLSKKLAKHGKLALLKSKIITSSRRWHKHGIWHTILLMHKLKILYALGVSPAKLKEMYADHK